MPEARSGRTNATTPSYCATGIWSLFPAYLYSFNEDRNHSLKLAPIATVEQSADYFRANLKPAAGEPRPTGA